MPSSERRLSYLSIDRYFEIGMPLARSTEIEEYVLEEIRRKIVQVAKELPCWKKDIPIHWTYFQNVLKENIDKKLLKRNRLTEIRDIFVTGDDDLENMLQFYKDMGKIIYFPDTVLRETIIIDVQWFVDAFKDIFTNPQEINPICETVSEWQLFHNTGRLRESTIYDLWGRESSYYCHKEEILTYMERLGIIAKVQWSDDEGSMQQTESTYYIPSINRTDLNADVWTMIESGHSTPIFIFSFTFLPLFFFYRLVGRCFKQWDVLRNDMIYKNAVIYKTNLGEHNIALGVTKSSIQLQVFTRDKAIDLERKKTMKIRQEVQKIISDITSTFHDQALYKTGFSCRRIKLTDEDIGVFLKEEDMKTPLIVERHCPLHTSPEEFHYIEPIKLLSYWCTVNISSLSF